jgi:hypothetical protein
MKSKGLQKILYDCNDEEVKVGDLICFIFHFGSYVEPELYFSVDRTKIEIGKIESIDWECHSMDEDDNALQYSIYINIVLSNGKKAHCNWSTNYGISTKTIMKIDESNLAGFKIFDALNGMTAIGKLCRRSFFKRVLLAARCALEILKNG